MENPINGHIISVFTFYQGQEWSITDFLNNYGYAIVSFLHPTIAYQIHGHICHIWRPKIRGQFFKRTPNKVKEDRELHNALLGFVYKCFSYFISKIQYQITSRTILKCFNIKNIKMKPPVVLFKKMIIKMARRHAKAYQHSCVMFA